MRMQGQKCRSKITGSKLGVGMQKCRRREVGVRMQGQEYRDKNAGAGMQGIKAGERLRTEQRKKFNW